jgi:type IV pilus assembly protein PilA
MLLRFLDGNAMRELSSKIPRAKVLRGFVFGLLVIAVFIRMIQALVSPPVRSPKKLQADELAAVQSLREIYRAQIQYQLNYPAKGYACSLSSLAGTPSSGSPGPQSAQLLHGKLATGKIGGYRFAVDDCTDVNIQDHHTYTDYEATAVPMTVGKTGKRGFCVDRLGEVTVDPAGEGNCSEALQ